MYFWIAEFGGVPSELKMKQHLVALDQLAGLLHVFGGL